jgi:hypothetical protein
MTSTTLTRIAGVALAMLAVAAPAATAMPIRGDEGIRPSSPPVDRQYQDLRNPDQRAPGPKPYQDLRNPDNRVPRMPSDLPQTMKPVELTKPAPAADSGPSPLVFIAPSLVLAAMLAAGFGYARTARRPARV